VQLLDCGISQRDYLTARLAVSERDKRVVRGTGVRNLKNPHSLVDDRSHIIDRILRAAGFLGAPRSGREPLAKEDHFPVGRGWRRLLTNSFSVRRRSGG
jgi:hypothetical protein